MLLAFGVAASFASTLLYGASSPVFPGVGAALVASLAVVAVSVLAVARAALLGRDAQKLFWAALGAGLLFGVAGHLGRVGYWPAGDPLPLAAVYGTSYLLLLCALLWLVRRTARRMAVVAALDSASVMLSGSVLIWSLLPVLGSAGEGGPLEVFAALGAPVCYLGLLCLSLVVLSTDRRPPFVAYLVGAFVVLLGAEGVYLGLAATGDAGVDEPGVWVVLGWAAGAALVGLAASEALRGGPLAASDRQMGFSARTVAAFWFSPLSPAVHVAFLMLWGALHPPLPAFALLGSGLVALYLALRISLATYLSRKLRGEAEALSRKAERARLSEELPGSLKESVHEVAALLTSYREARRNGESGAEDLLERAIESARETGHKLSGPVEELRVGRGAPDAPGLDFTSLLEGAVEDVRRYFRIEVHEDLRADLLVLGDEELAAAYRIASEALWNAARHSGARNVWLESREVGSVVLVKVRDDGRGLSGAEEESGAGFSLMRSRAASAGGALDVISDPKRGTTVQVRFDLRGRSRSAKGVAKGRRTT